MVCAADSDIDEDAAEDAPGAESSKAESVEQEALPWPGMNQRYAPVHVKIVVKNDAMPPHIFVNDVWRSVPLCTRVSAFE